jgi:hypothetical protein
MTKTLRDEVNESSVDRENEQFALIAGIGVLGQGEEVWRLHVLLPL